MKKISTTVIDNIYKGQKSLFASHQTKNIDFRLEKLVKLKSAVEKYELEILEALWKYLRKSKEEAIITEISIVNRERLSHQ